jgi:hypothetical protein
MPIMPGVMSALDMERNSVGKAALEELGIISEPVIIVDEFVSVPPIEITGITGFC